MKGYFRSTEEENHIFVPSSKVKEFDNLIDDFAKVENGDGEVYYDFCDKIDNFLKDNCRVYEGDLEDFEFQLLEEK